MFLALATPWGWRDGDCQDLPGKPWVERRASRLEQVVEKALGWGSNYYYCRSFCDVLGTCWMLCTHYRKPCQFPTSTFVVPFCRKIVLRVSCISDISESLVWVASGESTNSFVLSFNTQQGCIRHLLWMKHHSSLWKYLWIKFDPSPHRSYFLKGGNR